MDYFTKWAEAEPLATITKKKIEDFVIKTSPAGSTYLEF